MGKYLGLSRSTLNVITNVPIRDSRRRFHLRGEGFVMTQAEIGMTCFEDGERAAG